MKLNYEFGFLAKDCPLVSRELVNPWRLAALAVGIGILIAGSHLAPSADWDCPICFVMGLWAYVFAPWTVRALVYLDWNGKITAEQKQSTDSSTTERSNP